MHQKTAYERWCVGKVEAYSQCRSVFGMASYSWLNGPAMLPSCANLNLDDISLSRFWPYAYCHASWLVKAMLFSSCVWGVAYSLVLDSAVLKDEKYMINMQSHGFKCNLGIIAHTTGINCTSDSECNYSQIALESMWLRIQIHYSLHKWST